MGLAREGVVPVVTALFMTMGAWLISPVLGVILGLCTAFLAWFYREPHVDVPTDPLSFVSPANGKVVELEVVDAPFAGKSTKIGIFMSVMDVHVTEYLYDGKISFLDNKRGNPGGPLPPSHLRVTKGYMPALLKLSMATCYWCR